MPQTGKRRESPPGYREEPPLTSEDWTGIGFTLSETNPLHVGDVAEAPAPAPRWDMHFGLELGIVLSGRMRRLYRHWQTDLEPGQVWLCGMWERHGWQVLSPSCDHLVFVMLPQLLRRARFPEAAGFDWLAPFTAPPGERPQAQGSRRRELLATAQRFSAGIAASSGQRLQAAELLLFETLLLLLEEWKPRRRAAGAVFEKDYEAVNRAVVMALDSRRPLATAEAASECGMSTGVFARTFASLMGIPFSKFALRSRLGQAAAQLVNTENPVASIAAEWGFAHASHFQRAFKSHYGVPPSDYRRQRVAGSGASTP